MTPAVAAHCAEIERCNQRGGRMLSIVDLLEAGTLSRGLATYSLAAIGGGASFMIGASPGGAGKTTVMGALLNLLPAEVALAAADGLPAIRAGQRAPRPRRCFIGHEIGPGAYFAYLWGEPLRAYFELPAAGHTLATNLHADTLDEARTQICAENGVPEEPFRRMNLVYFLTAGRSARGVTRRVTSVWESDGRRAHRQVFDGAADAPPVDSPLAPPAALRAAEARLERLLASGARTIDEVRSRLTLTEGSQP